MKLLSALGCLPQCTPVCILKSVIGCTQAQVHVFTLHSDKNDHNDGLFLQGVLDSAEAWRNNTVSDLSPLKDMERCFSESAGVLTAVRLILNVQSSGSGLPHYNSSFLEPHHILSGSLANSNVHHAFFCVLLSLCLPAVISSVSVTVGA